MPTTNSKRPPAPKEARGARATVATTERRHPEGSSGTGHRVLHTAGIMAVGTLGALALLAATALSLYVIFSLLGAASVIR